MPQALYADINLHSSRKFFNQNQHKRETP